MKPHLLIPLCLLAVGCATIGEQQLTVTFDSEVSGGLTRQDVDDTYLGRLPVTVFYEIDQMPVDAQGCFRVSGVNVEWQSGYKSSTPKVIRLCDGPGSYEHSVPYRNTDYAARSRDASFAYNRSNRSSSTSRSQSAATEPEQSSSIIADVVGALLLGASVYQASQGSYGVSSPADDTIRTQSQSSCSSDFECPYGQHCTKPLFSMEGVCTQPVDEYGIPQIMGPRSDSFQMRTEPACYTDIDCGIGARCSQTLNACVAIY